MPQNASATRDSASLEAMGYTQELSRRMSGFSNFAISLSIICILAGGITSFHLGFSAVGGASIGLGWPLGCLFSLIVAASMAQLASAFPTAGGLYHWAAILGGRCFGWVTAWFNLAGLVTVLAAINVGMFSFGLSICERIFHLSWGQLSSEHQLLVQCLCVVLITGSQGLINHRGIKFTTRLTDMSGYLILVISFVLTISLLIFAQDHDFSRLIEFKNYSGNKGGDVWPPASNLTFLFCLGLLLPAYTITGFDASAHTSEETVSAEFNVPRGIVRSVYVSGIFGWLMLCAVVLAMPSLDEAAKQGSSVFLWLLGSVLPAWLGATLLVGILAVQYICGLATVTSASRMMYAFARDGGLPWSSTLKRVSTRYLTPVYAIWTVVLLAVGFTIYTPVYSTITVVCVIFLYLSYIIPVTLGLYAHGRHWHTFGPWTLGRWFKPACLVSTLGCLALLWIAIQPPNEKALNVLGAVALTMILIWFGLERRRFKGPPVKSLLQSSEAS
jgi:amino acid transporter